VPSGKQLELTLGNPHAAQTLFDEKEKVDGRWKLFCVVLHIEELQVFLQSC
jgi:hypothetical protein